MVHLINVIFIQINFLFELCDNISLVSLDVKINFLRIDSSEYLFSQGG